MALRDEGETMNRRGFSFLILAVLLAGCGGPPTAIIVDQLSLTSPNPEFVAEATEMLVAAGYQVSYVPGEEVTVDFYEDFPRGGLIVFRTHMALLDGGVETALFTSEPVPTLGDGIQYDEHSPRVFDQSLSLGWYGNDRTEMFYSITPKFVGEMGRFEGATVLLVGCNGAAGAALSEAFIKSGAEEVIGWTGLVVSSHADRAALSLLSQLTSGTGDAVELTMNDAGPDPVYGSVLQRRR